MKRYRNIGSAPIDVGHKREYAPGEEFQAALDDAQEKQFIEIGALKVIKNKAASPKKK